MAFLADVMIAPALLVLVTRRRERAVEMPGPQSFAR